MDALELHRPQQRLDGRCWTIVLPRPGGADRPLQPETMHAAELMFFFDAPLAHVVRYEEHLRAMRQEQATRRLIRACTRDGLVRQLGAGGAELASRKAPRD